VVAMSAEQDKLKHSSRLYQDEVHIKKQTKIAKAHGIDVKEPHKFNKHHAMDCGNPKCMLCASPRKLFKELTIQEKRFYQDKLHNDVEDGND
jgi:hypothetical protein